MSFVVEGKITIDAKGAVTGVSVSKAQIEKLGKAGKTASDELAQIGTKVRASGQAAGSAAGQVGNLAAQWNDVFVMMAAGQNPMQLALQQGSQITQVIGPMGAAGAVQMLKTSFLSLINPVSLVTYAVLAGGAALVSWVASAGDAGDESEAFAKQIASVDEALKSYADAVDAANLSNEELEERFGASGVALKTTLKILEDIARSEAQSKIDETNAALAGLFRTMMDRPDLQAVQDVFNVKIRVYDRDQASEEEARIYNYAAVLLNASRELADSVGDIDAQVAATDRMLNAARALADIDGERSAAEDEVLRKLAEQLQRMLQLQGATDEQNRALREGQQLAGMIHDQWQQRAQYVARETTELQKAGQMQRLIAVWGQDSVVVTRARLQAERDAYSELVRSKVGANGLAASLMDAWDRANGVAEVDMEGNILAAEGATWSWADAMGSVAAQIHAIVAALASIGGGMITNAGKAAELKALRAGKSIQDAAVARQRTIREAEWSAREATAGGGVTGWLRRQQVDVERYQFEEGVRLDGEIMAARKTARTSGGGGGRGRASGRDGAARAAEREQKAVDNLIIRLQDELAASQESDPVKKEMIRYRDQLASATDEERAAVESLIRARQQEEEALRRQQEMWGFWGQTALTAIDDVDGALKMLLDTLLEASVTGGGPLGWIFGGQDDSGKGGLLGAVFSAVFPKKAAGGAVDDGLTGVILGHGGGREDKKLILTSPGEYIVNARATARHRALLDQINYGPPGFAQGGAMGGGAPSALGAPTGGREMTYNINVAGTGNEEVHRAVMAAIEASFEQYDSEVLAGRVRGIVNDKWSN